MFTKWGIMSYNSVTTFMERAVKFSWDEDKNTINKGKHGVSFEAAQYVFDDPFFIAVQDRFVEAEERWQTTGMVARACYELRFSI